VLGGRVTLSFFRRTGASSARPRTSSAPTDALFEIEEMILQGHGPEDGIGLDQLDLGGQELVGIVERACAWRPGRSPPKASGDRHPRWPWIRRQA
jgi:hypothetical protein